MTSPVLPPFVDSFDDPRLLYDIGLQFDINVGPPTGDTTKYFALITSEHRGQPKYQLLLSCILQPIADLTANLAALPAAFDLDVAVGAQEDVLGKWIGIGRTIPVPLVGVYFAFDTANVGWDQGTWWQTFNPVTFLITLPDDGYRTLLRATVASNHWDGTIPSAYAAWNALFAAQGFGLVIQDYGNMHMSLGLTGPVPDAVTTALFTGGYLSLKPAGVRIDYFMTPAVANTPYFGFDVENASISGWNVGAWGKAVAGI